MPTNPFTSFKLTPNFIYGHVLEWRIDPTFNGLDPHNFSVEVSGTMDFSVIEYTITVGNSFFALDKTRHKQNFSIDTYYRVLLTTADGAVFYSRTIAFLAKNEHTRRQYVIAAEISRKEMLRIRKYTGNNAWLLKRKAFGKEVKVVNLVDPISGAALTDNIRDHGTSYETGYYNPLGIMYSAEEQKQKRKLSEFGVEDTFSATFRTIGFPVIDTYDIIIDLPTDDRWLVKDKQSIPIPGTELTLIQLLAVQLVPYTDPLYKIKLPSNEQFEPAISA